MSRILAAAAALLLLLTASAQASAGTSCAHPLHWKLSHAQTGSIDSWGSHTYTHDHITLTSFGGDPYGGIQVRARAGGPWRICSLHGSYRSGALWGLPGTIGTTTRPSFAARSFNRTSPLTPASVVVAYARRAPADGHSCASPAVVSVGSGDGEGDSGARVRTRSTYDSRPHATMVAEWQAAIGSHVCEVAGWNAHGVAWHVRGGGDGSHTMFADRVIGNHDNWTMYLWVAFRR